MNDHSQQLAVLSEREARANQTYDDNRTPFETARDHYNALVDDNKQLVKERRADLMEIEILNDLLSRERQKNNELTTKLEASSRVLGSVGTGMTNAADIILKIIKDAQTIVDDRPAPVQEYAPKPSADKIPTNALSLNNKGWS